MASGRLVDYLGHGNIADRPAAPTLAADTIGVWWSDDTLELSIWDGAAWVEDVGGGVSTEDDVNVLTSTAGVCDIDCSLGNYFRFPLTENVTGFTFSNLPAVGKAQTIWIRIEQHASSPKTVDLTDFKWAGGTPGVVSAINSAIDSMAITSVDQGTRWEATLANDFS